MKRSICLKRALQMYYSGAVSGEIYDAMLMNMDVFCEDDGESEVGGMPETHTEAGYNTSDDSEAVGPCTAELQELPALTKNEKQED